MPSLRSRADNDLEVAVDDIKCILCRKTGWECLHRQTSCRSSFLFL